MHLKTAAAPAAVSNTFCNHRDSSLRALICDSIRAIDVGTAGEFCKRYTHNWTSCAGPTSYAIDLKFQKKCLKIFTTNKAENGRL